MRYKILCLFFLIAFPFCLYQQSDNTTTLHFDFNDHIVKENNNKVNIRAVGVSLVDDRFGNEKSALHFFGTPNSYLNLGTSNILKPKKATFSLWVNLQEVVRSGKGYYANPILITKNSTGEDFIIAYGFSYNIKNKRYNAMSTRDSLSEVIIASKDTVALSTWHHLVFTSDKDLFCFYIDGELQGKQIKGFETEFLEGDSVMLGRTTGDKNPRFTNALIDDIRIFHRVLSEQEIKALYEEPNPNRFKNILNETLKYSGIIVLLGLVILVLVIRNKRNLARQKEYYEMNNKIRELEIKVVKTQMNPHFISNCLSAIQNLIYSGQIDRAGEYLAEFSAFLRQVLDYSEKHYTSLAEELEIIGLYVDLERLRFKNNFTFEVDVEEGLALTEIQIPALITQPLVENAIWHGLLPLKDRSPKLSIHIYSEDSFVVVCIEDNGIGRSNSKSVTNKSSRGSRLATDKIESMNRLRNSDDFRMEVVDVFDENRHPIGTKIIIHLLYIREE